MAPKTGSEALPAFAVWCIQAAGGILLNIVLNVSATGLLTVSIAR